MLFTATHVHVPNADPRTLLQIHAPQDEEIKILRGEITLQGSQPASTPILFDWVIQSTAGTATTLTPQKNDRGQDEEIKCKLWKDFTGEPSAGDTVWQGFIHQQGAWPWTPAFPLKVKGGERLGLRYRSGTFVAVSFTFYLAE